MNRIDLSKSPDTKSILNKSAIKMMKTQLQPSFEGLNHSIAKVIYNSPKTIQKMLRVFTREKACVGNLPKEMITILRVNSVNPVEVGRKINEVKSKLAEIGNFLRILDDEILDMQKKEISKVCENIYGAFDLMINAMKKSYNNTMPKEFLETLEDISSEFLTDSMREIGIIPQRGSVQVKHLGSGSYANAYKISFLDEKASKLFHDKVLKVYKHENRLEKAQINVNTKSVHGVGAEANAALYIKKAVGHSLKKYNLITPYFFDLKNKIGFMDMADNVLPEVTKHVDFREMELLYGDLNPDNIVDKRIVDYGGILNIKRRGIHPSRLSNNRK